MLPLNLGSTATWMDNDVPCLVQEKQLPEMEKPEKAQSFG